MNKEEELKQITYQLADVNFYREPERYTDLFNQFISLSQETEAEGWKNKLTSFLPFVGTLEQIPFVMII